MSYLWHLLVYVDIAVLTALSLNLVLGYCGFVTMAHASYLAIGAYTYALTTLKLGWGFAPSVLLAVALAALLSLAVSVPAWRYKGDMFIIVSLAVQVLIFTLIYNWHGPKASPGTLANLTNGSFGLSGIAQPRLFGQTLQQPCQIALFGAGLVALCLVVLRMLLLSPWGRLLASMRDDELALRSLGKNTPWIKVQVFALSCGMVAIAGALYASYVGYIDPSVGGLDQSILYLSMVVVGGLGNLRGPVVGALVLVAVPELLRFAHLSSARAADVRLLLYGALLVLMVQARPQGIAGEYRVG